MKKYLFLLALALPLAVHAETAPDEKVTAETALDSSASTLIAPDDTEMDEGTEKPKKTFVEKLPAPIRWIIRNWSASDQRYAVSSFYNWTAQLMNTTSFEWINLNTPQGMELNMRSRVSHRLGPYFGWRFLMFGSTVDLSFLGKGSNKRKNEFTLSINSHLFNIDLIRRRTGGDFRVRKMVYHDPVYGELNIRDVLDSDEIGDYTKNSITGININHFVNHLKYSNPAAFTQGAIQLRSAGSPVVGIGYTRQKVETESASIFGALGLLMLEDGHGNQLVDESKQRELDQLSEQNEEEYDRQVTDLIRTGWGNLKTMDADGANTIRGFLTNRIPSTTTIDDWHIQLGYAYNLVFSRRLLLGLSAIASPGLKRVRSNNDDSYVSQNAELFSQIIQDVDGRTVSPDEFRYHFSDTHFNVNTFFKASLTYNFNRWCAGVIGQLSNYFYNNKGMKVNNGFGSVAVYLNYSFGRRKEYRYNGEHRQEYIQAALTQRHIAEMRDTMPAGNINKGESYADSLGKTPYYHKDVIEMGINGCDLVRGPEGKFGWFEIEDGYVTPRQDTDGRLKEGTRLEIDENGRFVVEAGHDKNFRTGNWWKSQLDVNQIPNQWYPEMLHYALRGKMTLYLRGRIFGTKKPVKLVLDDFYVNHGKESKSFYQVGIKSFYSRSAYSIEGSTEINGRKFRIYIEQKKSGKFTQMYISRIVPADSEWMSKLSDSRRISTLSIPGTHDAGTASLYESSVVNTAHTQNFSVTAQLYDGVRAFDIRLKNNLKYGHMFACREGFDSTMVDWDRFLTEHPGEVIIAMIGIDGGGKWNPVLTRNYKKLIAKYPHRFVENFDASTTLGDVRGKILVIRRQEDCPFGKLLKFSDNAVFDYDCFRVEDVYKEHKTWKKAKIVEKHIREAFENDDPNKWFITFNSVAWDPRHHIPYAYAWGGKARNIRRPLNKALREAVDLKDYNDFGIVFLDFYNDHGEQPQLVHAIIDSNYHEGDVE